MINLSIVIVVAAKLRHINITPNIIHSHNNKKSRKLEETIFFPLRVPLKIDNRNERRDVV